MSIEPIENKLPVSLLEKSIQSGSEYGWRQEDFLEVIEAARKLQIGIEGGLVQYVFEEGTCELYWLHYFTDEIKKGENWVNYCNRTAKEASDKFKKIISDKNIKKEAMESFELVRTKALETTDVDQYKVFIISFEEKHDPKPAAQPKPAPAEKRNHSRR
ncbi:hypothetical protein [Flavobacterium selenitireducens]|uniref:hypothetical protein n=1 Tax=Flavobacterium selenitireducens TaxID=2722704 RepID=UPI00168AEA6B|nr:hypothetical protein [Flavobacterium selenitireducens]MBD3582250.1 hypothetical protein [Flavobacterium selenitireducens]